MIALSVIEGIYVVVRPVGKSPNLFIKEAWPYTSVEIDQVVYIFSFLVFIDVETSVKGDDFNIVF